MVIGQNEKTEMAKSKVCSSCKEMNNPAFAQCWKCNTSLLNAAEVSDTSYDDRRKIEFDNSNSYEDIGTGLSVLLGIAILIVTVIFGPGYFADVIFGKMTTGQYVQEVRHKVTTEWPDKFRSMMHRVVDMNVPNEFSKSNDSEAIKRRLRERYFKGN